MKEKNHLDLAFEYWEKALIGGGWAIDATCGNGKDTQRLLSLIKPPSGLIGIDIQSQAIQNTLELIGPDKAHLFCQSHAEFPSIAYEKQIQIIVYNLGYLPKGNKELTTRVNTTLKSVENALNLIQPKGLISITCYPGHPEGEKEEQALLEFSSTLSPFKWSVSHHRWINRNKSPSLLLIHNT